MLDPLELARFLREVAEELRRIATYSFFLEPGLSKLAQKLDDRAAEFGR
jgi:hypothetical protein